MDFFDLSACQGVATLVLRMSGMALEPVPIDTVGPASVIEASPEVCIFYRFTLSGHPTSLAPRVDPLGDTHPQILGIGENGDFAGFLEHLESANRSAQFHAVVGRGRLTPGDGALVFAVTQNCRPTAWAGIPEASTISKNRDLLHGFL